MHPDCADPHSAFVVAHGNQSTARQVDDDKQLEKYVEELAADEKVSKELNDRVGFDTRGHSRDALN